MKAVAEGTMLARDLVNEPSNILTPPEFAKRAKALTKLGVKVEVLSEAQMKKLGMNSLLSVTAGTVQPARLIIMEYSGAAKNQQPYVLVGKGITFDSGGISLKPGAEMDEMKFDMCGAASVIGTMTAIVEMQLPLDIVAIVAAAENMPSGKATKPGDVVTTPRNRPRACFRRAPSAATRALRMQLRRRGRPPAAH